MNPYITVELFSVCGIHPTEWNLSYSAYQCFSDRALAELWARAQGPPHWPYREIVSHKMEAEQLHPGSKCGDLVWFTTFGKPCIFGFLKEWDNGTAIIRMNMNDISVRVR